jgi:hypothetical protein
MRQGETDRRARDNDDDHGVAVLMELLRMLIVKNNSEPLTDDEWVLFRDVSDTLLEARKSNDRAKEKTGNQREGT